MEMKTRERKPRTIREKKDDVFNDDYLEFLFSEMRRPETNTDEKKYDLYSKFSLDKHIKHYTNYLEVIIDKDGYVKYAIPNHITAAIYHLGYTMDEFYKKVCNDSMSSPVHFLADEFGFIFVWNNFIIGKPNDNQRKVLEEFRDRGVYTGLI